MQQVTPKLPQIPLELHYEILGKFVESSKKKQLSKNVEKFITYFFALNPHLLEKPTRSFIIKDFLKFAHRSRHSFKLDDHFFKTLSVADHFNKCNIRKLSAASNVFPLKTLKKLCQNEGIRELSLKENFPLLKERMKQLSRLPITKLKLTQPLTLEAQLKFLKTMNVSLRCLYLRLDTPIPYEESLFKSVRELTLRSQLKADSNASFPNLKKLTFYSILRNQDFLKTVVPKLTKLKSLKIKETFFLNAEVFQIIEKIPALKTLKFSKCHFNNSNLANIQLSNLKKVSFKGCEVLLKADDFKNRPLKYLQLSNQDFLKIENLPKTLRKLSLRAEKWESLPSPIMLSQFNLKELILHNFSCDPGLFAFLSTQKNLKSLALMDCLGVDFEELCKFIKNNNSFRNLSVNDSISIDDNLNFFEKLTFKTLDITNTIITVKALIKLKVSVKKLILDDESKTKIDMDTFRKVPGLIWVESQTKSNGYTITKTARIANFFNYEF